MANTGHDAHGATNPMRPRVLSQYLGDAFPPTDQQAAIIGAQPGPLLVVAGAGAGKTETMASRVVWLVANGYVRPEEVLGLTFTRKAAQELGKRIRKRLERLAGNEQLVRRLDPTGQLAENLTAIAPTVSTYDSYAGSLIREYGLLVPVEPDARLITDAELHSIAWDVVSNHAGALLEGVSKNPSVDTVVDTLLALVTSMGNEVYPPERIKEEAAAFIDNLASLPRGKARENYNQTLLKWVDAQQIRTAYADLAGELAAELRARGVVTFNEQMSVAAKLASEHAAVGASQRDRFRVVMLDEYQDTSHAQRVLLRSLFGDNADDPERHAHPLTVTAVGDPMQAIYGWRGATAANLAAFVEDFPLADGSPAPKAQLTTSWRNPPEVLALANSVSDAVLGSPDGTPRAVEPLEPKPEASPGQVEIGYFATEDEEVDAIADAIAADYNEKITAGEAVESAILVRKNRHSPLFAEALEQRGVPYEIVGVAGLLTVPEIADTVAVARMLVHPQDSTAALRILAGPACGLGLKDISALSQRAVNLAGGRQHASAADELGPDADARERLQVQLAELIADAENTKGENERHVGLADAVADLGETDRYSEEGLVRLQALSAKLRHLRKYSLGKRLPDLFADIISVFGIRTEVLSRTSATGPVHLDAFAKVVSSYPGSDLEGFLSYLDLAAEHEDGLEPGAVVTSGDRVHILTAHKAKGLEWDTVAVAHADDKTYASKVATFLTQVPYVPDDSFDAFEHAENRSDFQNLAKEYLDQKRRDLGEESARLFYVAVTRAAKRLLVTASAKVAGRKAEAQPYEHFLPFKEITLGGTPAATVMEWWDGQSDEDELELSAAHEGIWPNFSAEPEAVAGAAIVRAAQTNLPAKPDSTRSDDAGELFTQWENDVTALINEHIAAQSPEVAVTMPGTLTASDIVALRADPEQFARRARRPVPFKPNSYAKRGTAFHEWVEGFFGARPLLDDDELPGNTEPDVDAATLVRLKESFERSQWAGRTPEHIEHPFEIDLGTSTVRGRIDAIFLDAPDPVTGEQSWTIVDWKTGGKPQAADMRAAKLQLAVYKEAWRRIADDGRKINAVFFYVRTGENFAPADLPERAELEELLQSAAVEGLESDLKS